MFILACMSMYHVHVSCPRRPIESVGFPRTELQMVGWCHMGAAIEPRSLGEQSMFQNPDSSLQPNSPFSMLLQNGILCFDTWISHSILFFCIFIDLTFWHLFFVGSLIYSEIPRVFQVQMSLGWKLLFIEQKVVFFCQNTACRFLWVPEELKVQMWLGNHYLHLYLYH